MDIRLITVAEMPSFSKRAAKYLSSDKLHKLIDYLAKYPETGDVIEGTGGVRKMRFARSGSGKSGGVRVIYYYYNETHPILLLDIYGKNAKDNLTHAERNELEKLTCTLVSIYRRKK
jgi:hypothetical protein